jgi:hypothetical protein
MLNFAFFLKEEDTCNNPPFEKKPRWSEATLMQAARPSIIKYAGRITHDLDQPTTTQLIVPGPSYASVSSTQAGRKLKREWTASHNASAQPTQDRELDPLHVLPRSSDVEAQSEFVSIYIIFSFPIFKNKVNFLRRIAFDE